MRKIRHLSMTFTATLFHILLMLRGGNSIQSCHHKQIHSLMASTTILYLFMIQPE